jgi:4-hydroxybenzoyl-CoA thioesterase
VYFPRFFEYFDASTGALFEKAGFPKAEMLRTYGLVGIPLIEAAAQFYVPARFGETVEVESRVVEWGSSSFRVEHKLYKGSELAAEGRERRVWTVRDPERPSGLRSEPVPQDVKDRFR